MANQVIDNVYTTCFTPREYQVELLDAAKKRNIIICLGSAPTKAFISIKLIQELSKDVRHNKKKTVHITNEQNVDAMAACLGYLTDLHVKQCKKIDSENDVLDVINSAQVIVTTSLVFSKLIIQKSVQLNSLNLIIIDECHSVIDDKLFLKVMNIYGKSEKDTRPRILCLTSSLFEAGGKLSTLEAALDRLERTLHSTAETASDIVTLLRYSHKPVEMIIECGRPMTTDLSEKLRAYIFSARKFLNDHRYDPFEMYDDEFKEELKKIPNPKLEPHTIFDDFLFALNNYGPWCADRAALVLLMRTEKLKVRTPYERHFLLLCMASSVLLRIRSTCDDVFEPYSELERIRQFSSPKILRLIEVFRQFKPEGTEIKPIKSDTTSPNTNHETRETSTSSSSYTPNNDTEPAQNDETSPSTDILTEDSEIAVNDKMHHIQAVITKLSEIAITDEASKACETSNSIGKKNEIYPPNDESRELSEDETTEDVKPNSDNLDKNSDMKIDSPYKSCDKSNAVVCDKINSFINTMMPQYEPRGGSRNTRKGVRGPRRPPHHANINPDALCGIIFVQERITARILFYLMCELSRHDPEFSYISVQFTVDKFGDASDTRELEMEHRNQEEVLKKFRMHECNLLVSTSILEEGIDVPRCNVIVHFDKPKNYRSYVHCKGRARPSGAYQVFIIEEDCRTEFVQDLAEYYEIENILLRKCMNKEPPQSEELEADQFVYQVACYRPPNSETATVNLSTAISLLNRYCARLPSDTFTRLTPIWNIFPTNSMDIGSNFQCSLRLPINSPLKQTILGPAMKTRVLARRITALRACKALHEAGELDDNLMPIGKEGFRASEPDWDNFPLDTDDEQLAKDSSELRPGTTKRRQYYTKRIAETLIDCKPMVGTPAYLYHIKMILTCPLPEEQNTRGRKIYPPEESPQGFGILTLKPIPKICSFPIFTRSGEVNVELALSKKKVILDDEQLTKICEFLNYMFTSVLRLQKYLMVYDPDASENSYLIVPTYKYKDEEVLVDWNFLDRIYENKNLKPNIIPEEDRRHFKFHPSKYQDAVVMPWYRNQDQPQYFYVAEMCYHLSPKSTFPGADYNTFEEYYYEKYDIQIQNYKQPLLDVDHTSARLNFLTPRYVNRKGVALPTSSEETKRAKRENLEHKQILVPELCTVHPFPASLWRKAVCLPCILYRINALLLADQIRKQLARDLALGQIDLDKNFIWPQLDFGWSLAAVLKKSNDAKLALLEKKENETIETSTVDDVIATSEVENQSDEVIEVLDVTQDRPRRRDWMEIGTWSNEMADNVLIITELSDNEDDDEFDEDFEDRAVANPSIRYGSPTSMLHTYHSYSDEFDYSDSDNSMSLEDSTDDYQSGLLRIEFKGENIAEAIEANAVNDLENALGKITGPVSMVIDTWNNENVHKQNEIDTYLERFKSAVSEHKHLIESKGILIDKSTDIIIEKSFSKLHKHDFSQIKDFDENNPDLIQVPSLENNTFTEESQGYCCSQVDYFEEDTDLVLKFQFDEQPILENHPGPSPSVILQALTMSNANDGINLERLETIGDSFLKYAITTYLYCTYENVHEGKLSHLRSKQVSNLNLYRLGRRKTFGESMIATKFEPHDNWLPPCYYVPQELEQALIDAKIPAIHWQETGISGQNITRDEFCRMVRERGEQLAETLSELPAPQHTLPCVIPYNLLTQQSIPDKSIADCVEALIGAYLIECGPRGALLFMAWLGIRVLPIQEIVYNNLSEYKTRPVGSLEPVLQENQTYTQIVYGTLKLPKSPLLRYIPNPEGELERLLDGYEEFERAINYKFRDRSYLLQSLTHASYFPNQLTDCYQRLEFLGDAVLDYLITRHLYEDTRQHSPGALTDLRSALVNNTIFASLAVRYGFHKYFRHLSPGLHEIIDRFVRIQESNGHLISEEYYLIEEDECEEAEDVEVPKALGDVFESVAGAIFLDSGMSLDAVWRVYYRMMHAEIELFSTHVPKSPIRELLELEPETAKFGKPEKLADGRRVRVSVEVFGKGIYKGIGRNYRIAKCTAAKCALKQLRLKYGLLVKRN